VRWPGAPGDLLVYSRCSPCGGLQKIEMIAMNERMDTDYSFSLTIGSKGRNPIEIGSQDLSDGENPVGATTVAVH